MAHINVFTEFTYVNKLRWVFVSENIINKFVRLLMIPTMNFD
ncbi:hypothetical protein YE105_C3511 [Yersinia enterocolitica subsp. palearctica 105.5R(r)]|uniref:Uncharacterized protein n=1 Tax=Yersinia enterocolitica W22703 TaxID=913028 RepID=F4N6A8_YEREN|nr:hypothetical protein YE105_C3511 [Yersinia enterocolitica subsp. palearctica 105.5R(r)]CBX73616.1 unknown protein [Yersinia enterocolitica W22703]